jgi:hypothetical protein
MAEGSSIYCERGCCTQFEQMKRKPRFQCWKTVRLSSKVRVNPNQLAKTTKRQGKDKLSMREINREIAAFRQEQKR